MILKINQTSRVIALQLYTKILPILIILMVIVLLMSFYTQEGGVERYLTSPWSISCLVIFGMYVCYEYFSIKYIVESMRIDIQDQQMIISYRGVFRTKNIPVPMSQITDVYTHQGVVERFLGISEIRIVGSSVKPLIVGGFDARDAILLRDAIAQSISLQ